MQRKTGAWYSKRNMSDSRQIYALVDPRDNTTRYVGMSKDAQSRLQQHLSGYTGGKAAWLWIKELKELGVSPELHILETIETGPDAYYIAHQKEEYWISKILADGQNLLNIYGNTRPYSKGSSEEPYYDKQQDITEEQIELDELLNEPLNELIEESDLELPYDYIQEIMQEGLIDDEIPDLGINNGLIKPEKDTGLDFSR